MTTEKLKAKSKTKTPEKADFSPRKNAKAKVTPLKMRTVRLPVLIRPGEMGYFIVEVPVLPGCISQGKTKEEALANIREAAEVYLMGEPLPASLKEYVLTEVEVKV